MGNVLRSSFKFNAVVWNLPPLRSDRLLSAKDLKKGPLQAPFPSSRVDVRKITHLSILPSIHPTSLSPVSAVTG